MSWFIVQGVQKILADPFICLLFAIAIRENMFALRVYTSKRTERSVIMTLAITFRIQKILLFDSGNVFEHPVLQRKSLRRWKQKGRSREKKWSKKRQNILMFIVVVILISWCWIFRARLNQNFRLILLILLMSVKDDGNYWDVFLINGFTPR